VKPDDTRITTERLSYPSPGGGGTISGLFVKPANATGKLPAVLVVHENRGLNPYVEDVARRVGIAGFMALAPDALSPLGGYPGTDDAGRAMQQKRNGQEMLQDFVNGAESLMKRPDCTGKVGVVGFCYGGSVSNQLAVRLPGLAAAVPFYGGQPADEDVPKIKAPLLIHYAGLDERVNAGWPAYEAALKAYDKLYTMYMYAGVNHGFHNDTTPRYDKAAAELAWARTIEFFNKHLQ
jgi:carboxymethylenebutenolidase